MPLPGIPMIKRETVKDDGRPLIYYTFPAEDGGTEAPPGESAEDAHV